MYIGFIPPPFFPPQTGWQKFRYWFWRLVFVVNTAVASTGFVNMVTSPGRLHALGSPVWAICFLSVPLLGWPALGLPYLSDQGWWRVKGDRGLRPLQVGAGHGTALFVDQFPMHQLGLRFGA